MNRNILGIDDRVLEAFYKYSWPGNVRELENVIESAMNCAPLNRKYLEKEDFITNANIFNDSNSLNANVFNLDKPLPYYLEEIERKIILEKLKKIKIIYQKQLKS